MDLIAFLLERDGPLAKVIRQNANVVKALELTKEEEHLFPSHRSLQQWALLRTTEPDQGARLAQEVQADKFGRLADAVDYALSPDSGDEVLNQYWTRKLNGDGAGAVQLYQHAVQEGVPLPPL